ncbi:hypothetical protein WG947_04430 [Pontibacter sp. H259]|uniref:hypothetical protein n=1 Tax=Pontibacter sp. H259 TaxID=3133421 RepID=UPI0030BCA59E
MLNLLLLSYWPLNDVLTQGVIVPNIKLLQQVRSISKIILVTIERENLGQHDSAIESELSGIKHIPLHSRNYKLNILNKVNDFILFPKQLRKIVEQEKVDFILGHGSPAGALAYKVYRKIGLPFYVSSFEPHADYMLESGVWSRYGLKYIMQKHWEKQQRKSAFGLMPVAENYKQTLLAEGLSTEIIRVVPCVVNSSDFKFEVQKRIQIRAKLGWEAATIGIYIGKYGGLYYNDEAFQIYQLCFQLIPNFRLIILSPQPVEELTVQLQKYNLDSDKVYLATVPHSEVPAYLSVADFAFATYKPGPSKKYLSPIKIGEYWANGLPVLLTEGVGDDSDIIKNEGGGAVFNLQENGSLEQAIRQIQTILQTSAHRHEIPKLALKYRSPEQVLEAYNYFFNQLQQS